MALSDGTTMALSDGITMVLSDGTTMALSDGTIMALSDPVAACASSQTNFEEPTASCGAGLGYKEPEPDLIVYCRPLTMRLLSLFSFSESMKFE
jgi:hypothetical protein